MRWCLYETACQKHPEKKLKEYCVNNDNKVNLPNLYLKVDCAWLREYTSLAARPTASATDWCDCHLLESAIVVITSKVDGRSFSTS